MTMKELMSALLAFALFMVLPAPKAARRPSPKRGSVSILHPAAKTAVSAGCPRLASVSAGFGRRLFYLARCVGGQRPVFRIRRRADLEKIDIGIDCANIYKGEYALCTNRNGVYVYGLFKDATVFSTQGDTDLLGEDEVLISSFQPDARSGVAAFYSVTKADSPRRELTNLLTLEFVPQ